LGNNNAYCQNNKLSWFDWSALARQADLLRFVKGMIGFIQHLAIFREKHILATNYNDEKPYIVWHGVKLGQPDWGEDSHSLAFSLCHPRYHEHLHVILNAYWEPLIFELPPLADQELSWHRIVDTAQASPEDFCELPDAPLILENFCRTQARTMVVLMARSTSDVT
jgi:glycogen operon protein